MTLVEKARQLRPLIEKAVQSLPDEEALTGVTLFPHWSAGIHYNVGDKLQYNGVLYSVLQAHTSQDNWTPDAAPSLFAKVLIPDEEKIYEWKKPGSTNPYKKGDKVMFEGKIYESIFDGNIWSPSEHPAGWKLIN